MSKHARDLAVRVAIAGTGWGTNVLAPFFRRVGMEVVGIWGRSAAAAKRAGETLGIARVTTNYAELLGWMDVDLVVVATAPAAHKIMTVGALAAGKHVWCEKPMALNVEEAVSIASAANNFGDRVALLGHELRFLPVTKYIRQVLESGRLGDVTHVNATVRNATMLQFKRHWNWESCCEQGGGFLFAMGSHYIDLITWIVRSTVISVKCELSITRNELPDCSGERRVVTADDACRLYLRYANGLQASLFLSGASIGPPHHEITFYGNRGGIRISNGNLFAPADRGVTHLTVAQDVWASSLPQMSDAVRLAIVTKDKRHVWNAASLIDGVHTQKVMEAARESDRVNAWLPM